MKGHPNMQHAQMPEPVVPPGTPIPPPGYPPPLDDPADPNDAPVELPPQPVDDPEIEQPPPMHMAARAE